MYGLFGKYYCGSYTVEMSFVSPVILIILLQLFYTGIYVHNRAVIEEAVYQSAIIGSMMDTKNLHLVEKEVQQTYEKIISNRLFGIEKDNLVVTVDFIQVKVEANVRMKTWYYLGGIKGYYGNQRIQYSEAVEFIYPKKMIYLAEMLQAW